MKVFSVGTKIVMGNDANEYFKTIENSKIYIVTDKFMRQHDAVNKIEKMLLENNNEIAYFDEILPNPTVSTVKIALENMINIKSNIIIAIGGGSVIDTAKAIMYFCIKTKEKIMDLEYIPKPLFIAVPTTSGTGSEVTSFSVLTDDETHRKIPLVDDIMIPDVAVLDATFTLSVPQAVTADTGMDVITHGIEAYVSSNSDDFSDMYAQKSLKIAFENILLAYKDGTSIQARQNMHNASCMAGVAFNNAGLGINHSLAHAIGGYFKLSHGKANAILLPYVIRYNSGLDDDICDKYIRPYVEIAMMLNLKYETDKEAVEKLIDTIRHLNSQMSIPNSFSQLNVSKDEYLENINDFTMTAIEDICTKTNIRNMSEEGLKEILLSAF